MNTQLQPVKMKTIREKQKMTKQALSWKSGLNASLIGQIESGRYIPYDSQLEKLAKALNVKDPDTLLEPIEG